jgi:glucose/arabinose dehydrogenase
VKSKPAALLILLVILGLLLPAEAVAEFTVPAGFVDEEVVVNVPAPTAIDWLPPKDPKFPENRDILVATQGGVVFSAAPGSTAIDILNLRRAGTICSGGEIGLLGLAVDPNFASGERYVYLYYTDSRGSGDCGAANRANRVSRFTMNDEGLLINEEILIDNIPAPGGNHNGGDLQFGSDGLLYISVGDGGQDLNTGARQNGNGNARRLDLLNGKILRIMPDGGIPAGNPFQDSGTVRCNSTGLASGGEICQEIFATGLRNPFRIAFDPNDTDGAQRFYINDVGGGAWEEINNGAPDADYGWNVREGPCLIGSQTNCPSDSQFVGPVFAYPRNGPAPFDGCTVVTGGVFVPNTGTTWPDKYDKAYLFADLGCAKIFVLRNESSVTPRSPASNQEDQQTERKKNKKGQKDRKGKKQKKGKKGKRERRRDRRDEKQDRRKKRRDNRSGSPTVGPDPIPPSQAPEVFATGGPGTGAIHLKFGPDGVLYYTTFDGGGQVRKIVRPG